jgi:hypothetical protein
MLFKHSVEELAGLCKNFLEIENLRGPLLSRDDLSLEEKLHCENLTAFSKLWEKRIRRMCADTLKSDCVI